MSFIETLDYKPAHKKNIKYKFIDVKNNFNKLKKYSFTIATEKSELKTIINNKEEVKRDIEIGHIVLRGPMGDIYSTTADRFFMSYNLNAEAITIPIKKPIAIVPKNIFGNNEYLTFTDVYGKKVKVYPNDGIIKHKNPKTGLPEYWRIDKEVLRKTYNFS